MAKKRLQKATPIEVENFLAAQGYADPDEMRMKISLANRLALLVDELDLTQSEIAVRTGLAQSDVSRIVNGSVKNYSVWRLMTALTALGQTVTIAVEPAGQERGAVIAA
jgi:predicted XRE-type DNA-binding protein